MSTGQWEKQRMKNWDETNECFGFASFEIVKGQSIEQRPRSVH